MLRLSATVQSCARFRDCTFFRTQSALWVHVGGAAWPLHRDGPK